MSSNEYITIADITNGNLKQFPETYKQSYVDRTNDWYEAYAQSKDVSISGIEYPVNITVLELLRAKMLMLFSVDNMGGTNTNVGADGLYQLIYVTAKDQYAQLAPVINGAYISGRKDSSAATIIFGRRER